MSNLGEVIRGARQRSACLLLLGTVLTSLPGNAATRATAIVTATVHDAVTIRAGTGTAGAPTVATVKPRAYSVRQVVTTDHSFPALRTIYVDFD